MKWLLAFTAVVAALVAIRKLAAYLKPLPDAGTRRCPHCGHEFQGERRYCIACGGQIWDDVLSEKS